MAVEELARIPNGLAAPGAAAAAEDDAEEDDECDDRHSSWDQAGRHDPIRSARRHTGLIDRPTLGQVSAFPPLSHRLSSTPIRCLHRTPTALASFHFCFTGSLLTAFTAHLGSAR